MEQVQPDDLGVCKVPGCGLPVRKLSPFVVARASYCADHLIEDCTETSLRRGVWRSPEQALREVALYLPGGAEARRSAGRRRRKPAKRVYTINDKREVVQLYRSGPMQATEIARHLDIPEGTVKSWIKRHLEDPYFTKEDAA
jgi:Helix-turn-helix domain